MKAKRSRIEIYYEILVAIQNSATTVTGTQLRTGLSYYPTKTFVSNLEEFGLLTRNPLEITEKGCACVTAYSHYQFEQEKINAFFTTGPWNLIVEADTMKEELKQAQQIINTLKAIIEEYEKWQKELT